MGFEDPSKVTGSEEHIWNEFGWVRDEIKDEFSKFFIENMDVFQVGCKGCQLH